MIKWSEVQTPQTAADVAKEIARTEAAEYLVSTNQYVIDMLEIGTEIPEEVKEARAKARLTLADRE